MVDIVACLLFVVDVVDVVRCLFGVCCLLCVVRCVLFVEYCIVRCFWLLL